MSWLFLLLAAGAFTLAFTTSSPLVMGLSLLAAAVLIGAWLMGLLAQRVGNAARDDAQIIDPLELRRLREQAEARRAGTTTNDAMTTSRSDDTSPA